MSEPPSMPPVKSRDLNSSPSLEQKKRTILQLRSAILEYSDRIRKKSQELKVQRVCESVEQLKLQGWHRMHTSIQGSTSIPSSDQSLAAFGCMLKVD